MRKSTVAVADVVAKPLTDTQATDVMWGYYRDNKANLMTDIKEYRDFILSELLSGVPAAQVFARFMALPAPTKHVRHIR